ncbi:MAG: glycosyltransferase family 1 protein [Bacteroidota bacterium]|nr:glycosyltransferase family 1 protein [Bacteroidota bacterium]
MDLVCFCHIRWNFVYQRPQHLMSRFARYHRVFFIEEPIFQSSETARINVHEVQENIFVITPHLLEGSADETIFQQKVLLSLLYEQYGIKNYMHWYYTPMSLAISNHLQPEIVIYDCMDELSNFKFAPPELKQKEKELFRIADVVFTGGHSLYQAKKNSHHNIYPFPSSIEMEHFSKARSLKEEPHDQEKLPHPVFGFYGVVDERFDIGLLGEVAQRKPEWSFVIIGPVVKIDPASLPNAANIYYLGGRKYEDLPGYLSRWDVAMIPFLLNDSTKYISPTKTPEYLAAGVPVISSSIADVVNPYGMNKLVHIADNADDFIAAAETELAVINKTSWLNEVDNFLKDNSWDNTWSQMNAHINNTIKNKTHSTLITKKESAYV